MLSYLTGEYYNSLPDNIRNVVVNHTYDVSPVSLSDNLSTQISEEKKYQWNGKNALIIMSDYIKVNSNRNECNFIMDILSDQMFSCGNYNWMASQSNNYWWAILPIHPENSLGNRIDTCEE